MYLFEKKFQTSLEIFTNLKRNFWNFLTLPTLQIFLRYYPPSMILTNGFVNTNRPMTNDLSSNQFSDSSSKRSNRQKSIQPLGSVVNRFNLYLAESTKNAKSSHKTFSHKNYFHQQNGERKKLLYLNVTCIQIDKSRLKFLTIGFN